MSRWFVLIGMVLPGFAFAQTLADADEIVMQANLAAYYAGKDGRSEARMIIKDSQGREQRRQFTVLRRTLTVGGDQEFLVTFSRSGCARCSMPQSDGRPGYRRGPC